MKGFGSIGTLGVALAMFATPFVWAQDDTIHTVAGRGIGDGRAATAATLDSPTGVGIAADGGILIADSQHQRIRRVDPGTGVITTFMGTLEGSAGNGATPDVVELRTPVRAFLSKTGDVLVAERDGNRIRRVRKDNGLVDTVPVGANIPGFALKQPNDVAEDSAGNLYIADMGNHRIVEVTALGVTTTFAGTGAPGFTGDGPAASVALNFPACVAVAPGDVVYVCDKANHRIRKVQGGVMTTVAGTGVAAFTGDGPGTTVALNQPEDIVVAAGALVFSDQENNRIRQFNLANGAVTTLAGTGPSSFGGENVPGASSTLASPMGLALTTDGRLLFAERDAHRLRALANGTLTTVAGDGVDTFGGDGGPALDATFHLVEGVAADASGNLFVSDSGNNRIRKVDAASGTVTTIAGNGTTTFGVDGVPATVVGIDSPSDVVVDAAGNVIFSDTHHHRVRSVDTGGLIHTIMGNGLPGFSGDGGPAANAQLASPTGLALDTAGNLYVADFDNHRIRKIDTAGNVQTVAGDGTGGFNGDGLAASATSLNNPTDVAFDASGNMIIADMRNHRIRRLDAASGTITTIAGTGTPLSSDDFIPAVTATLLFPTDVAVDASGNVLIADSGSNRIRRVMPNGVIDSVVGSRTPGDSGDEGPALQARLLTPLRMFMAPDGRLLIVDRDNHRIRAVGEASGGGGGGGGGGSGDPDCTKGTCATGGGSRKTDCFVEFNAGMAARGQKFVCKDGDPTCDHDSTPRQCTVSLKLCFGVADPRLGKCTPQGVKSVQMVRPISSVVDALGRQASASVGGGAKPLVTFADAVTGCTASSDVVVPIKKRKGKVVLKTMASTGTGGRLSRDPDTVTVVCVP
jgi:sugar lactone lactonase YvrE